MLFAPALQNWPAGHGRPEHSAEVLAPMTVEYVPAEHVPVPVLDEDPAAQMKPAGHGVPEQSASDLAPVAV